MRMCNCKEALTFIILPLVSRALLVALPIYILFLYASNQYVMHKGDVCASY